MMGYWEQQIATCKAGRIKHHYQEWCQLTSDQEVLETILGLPVDVMGDLTANACYQYPFGNKEHAFVEAEIKRLLHKGVVVNSKHEEGELISPIFVRPKADKQYRLILNLKHLNEVTEYTHFKMETLASILRLVTPGAFMAKIDIKDAYYSVPIRVQDQKLLKFKFDGVLHQFTVLPNGYSPGPRKFTKLLKPPLATLRKLMVTIAAYIDDMFTLAKTYDQCRDNILKIVKLFESLGFVIHPQKSTFIPTNSLEFLGVIIDSVKMSITLTEAKKITIISLCHEVLNSEQVTIRKIAQLGGKFSSSFIAVPEGKLHYRGLERDKTKALARNKGNYDKTVILSLDGGGGH